MIKLSLLVISLTVFFATIYYVNGENWLVQVGGAVGKNIYVPANFDANVGDTVTFEFVDGTHDVIQADAAATCAKSKIADPFFTPKFPGNAATPPQAVWPLPKVGKLFYFCDVADHCTVGKMFGQINVLDAGAPLGVPGVKGPPAAPAEPGPAPAPSAPIQPATPADDLPNQPQQPPIASPSPSATPKSTSTQPTPLSASANTDKQISIAVVGGALLSSLTGYFLFL